MDVSRLDPTSDPASDPTNGHACDPKTDRVGGSAPHPAVDPVTRCFGGNSPLYQDYHDFEWGRVVHGDTELFERLSLEGFSSGLSWLIVLRKRDDFRAAFANFDPAAVAAFGPDRVEELMSNSGIVRNWAKINATVANAKALVAFQAQGGSLDQLIWSHRPAQHRTPRTYNDLPSKTQESVALTKALQAIGFTWVGPVTTYATMQACGLVNDHLEGCALAGTASR